CNDILLCRAGERECTPVAALAEPGGRESRLHLTGLRRATCGRHVRGGCPGVCGPRRSSTQTTAVSRRSKLKTSCRRCSYFVTRLSAPPAGPAIRFSCSVVRASRTDCSSRGIPGSRVFFL